MLAKIIINHDNSICSEPIFTKFDIESGHVTLDNSEERLIEFNNISNILSNKKLLDDKWYEHCQIQKNHYLKETIKGMLAMLPQTIKMLVLKGNHKTQPNSYFAKGARMIRGMFQCENHSDVMARIFRDFSEKRGNFKTMLLTKK